MRNSACTSPGKAEGGTSKPPPKKQQQTQKGRNTHPTTNARPPAKKRGGGARDSHTTANARTHSTGGGRAPLPGNTRGDTHGAPQTITGGPACPTRRHPAESSRPPRLRKDRRKGHPGHADAHLTGEVAGRRPHRKKKQTQPKRRGKGGRGPRGPTAGQAAANTTEPRYDRTENHTHTPRSQKKKEGGGRNPTHSNPRTTQAHRQPH